MSIFFAANHMDAFENQRGRTSSATDYSRQHVDAPIDEPRTGFSVASDVGTAADGFWLHFIYGTGSSYTSQDRDFGWVIKNTNGDLVLDTPDANNGEITFRLYGASGGTQTVVSGTDPYLFSSGNTPYTMDIHIYTDSGNAKCDIYRESALYASITVTGEAHRGCGSVEFGSFSSSDDWFTEVILADESTLGMRVASMKPDSNGTHQDWGGSYTDVRGDVTYQFLDSTFVSVDSVGQKATYNTEFWDKPDTLPPFVKAVVSQIACAGTGNIQAVIRSGTTDYNSPDMAMPATLTQSVMHIWEQNPATNEGWINLDEVDDLEFGFESS
jgi:hypothetical protein